MGVRCGYCLLVGAKSCSLRNNHNVRVMKESCVHQLALDRDCMFESMLTAFRSGQLALASVAEVCSTWITSPGSTAVSASAEILTVLLSPRRTIQKVICRVASIRS